MAAGGILLAAVGVTGALGGFDEAPPRPADRQTGEWIELTRWDLRVDGCQRLMAAEADDSDKVLVDLTVVNTWHTSLSDYNRQAWRFEVPDGPTFGGDGGEWPLFRDTERSGYFDPGIERPALVTLDLEGRAWTDDRPLRLTLATERPADGMLIEGSWWGEDHAATLDLDCEIVQEEA